MDDKLYSYNIPSSHEAFNSAISLQYQALVWTYPVIKNSLLFAFDKPVDPGYTGAELWRAVGDILVSTDFPYIAHNPTLYSARAFWKHPGYAGNDNYYG